MNITVRLNVLSGMVEITGMPPQYSKANAANVLPVLLSDYMTKHGMKFTRQGLDDSLVLIEDENRFNPIADMLHTVRHDGTDRLAELVEIAGIADAGLYHGALYSGGKNAFPAHADVGRRPAGAQGKL